MSWTRANVETEIVDRCGPKMAWVAMPVTTVGSNASLNGPIRRAVQGLGGVAAGFTVTDADIAPFAGWQLELLADWATLQTLKSILLKLTDVTFKIGQEEYDLTDMIEQTQAQITMLEARLAEDAYGPSLPGGATAPMNSIGNVGRGTDIPNDPYNPHRTRSRFGHWPYP